LLAQEAVLAGHVEMNEADERAMAKRTGFQRGVLRQALRRLVALD
jgi:DNA-binding GntR family transcriptional regulator